MNNNSPTSTKQIRQRRNRRRRQRRNLDRKAKKIVNLATRRAAVKTNLTSVPRISECAKDYARAVTNPFGRFANLPCIPDFTIIPSNKIQVKIRGTFSTGTQGSGFVLFNPRTAVFGNTAGAGTFTDLPLIKTGVTYADNNITYAVAGGVITTPGVTGADSNSPYVSNPGDYTEDWKWRVVAAGLKCQYMGTDFKNQGSVYLYQSPSNENIPGDQGLEGSDLLESNYTVMLPVRRKSEYVYYQPKLHDDTYFQSADEMFPTRTDKQNFILGIYVEGGDIDAPQNWSFEATAFYEIQGAHLTLSPSHSDPTGYAGVISSLPNVNPTTAPELVTQSVLQRTMSYIGNGVSNMVTQAAPVVGNMILDRLMGGSNSLPQLTFPTVTDL